MTSNQDTVVPNDGERLAEVLDGYLQQLEQGGTPPNLEALIAAHPDLETDLRECVESLQLLHHISSNVQEPKAATRVDAPNRLGDYEIVCEIGRGGMGVVYEARQLSLNRRVALKVLPFASVLDEKQIARFRNEAQAAASLHHPNIVPVYGVGDERGVHYFAMQYVAGQSLDCVLRDLSSHSVSPRPEAALGESLEATTTADVGFSTRVSTRSRAYCESIARLGMQVADALAHAHEQGVIHRDVKPSNLLVDRDGKVWVTDFGLARVESSPGVTMSGDLVGTLRYMSPEQATGKPAPIDARTDVYSLGVTLYELLTLKHAHPADNRHDLLEQLEKAEPISPRRVNPSIPYDLETIVLKAMAKARDDRYDSAEQLADDLRCFLDGRGTKARRLSPVDRVARWAMRNQKPVAAAALCVMLLAILSTAGWIAIAREQRHTADALAAAESHLQRAETHFGQAREAVDRFGIILSDQLAGTPETGAIRRVLLEDTRQYYEEFIEQIGDDPSLARQLAATLHKSASVSERLGDNVAAETRYRQAADQYESLVDASPSDVELVHSRGQCVCDLASCLATKGDMPAADAKYEKAMQILDALPAESKSSGKAQLARAEVLSDWGLLLSRAGRKDPARDHLSRAVAVMERLSSGAVEWQKVWPRLAAAYNNLSYVQREEDWQAALHSNASALDILRQLVALDASSNAWQHDLALCQNNRGAIQAHLDNWEAAVESHRAAAATLEQLARKEPSVVAYRRDLAVNRNNLGQALSSIGDLPAAEAEFESAKRIVEQLAGDYPATPDFRSLLAGIMNNQAMVQEAAGNVPAAIEGYSAAIESQSSAIDLAPGVKEYRDYLLTHQENHERVLGVASDDTNESPVDKRMLVMTKPDDEQPVHNGGKP